VIPLNELRRGSSGEWQIAGSVDELFPRTESVQGADNVVRRRSWPELIRDTFVIYRRACGQLWLMALLTAVPSFFLQEMVSFTLPSLDGSMPQWPKLTPAAIALLSAVILLWPISTAGMQLAADSAAHKQPQRLRDLLRNAIALWPRIFLLGLVVYGSFFFWLVVPFTAMLSLVSAAPTIMSLLLILLIGVFTVYMNARLFINFLFWEQTGALTALPTLDALRESKRLARSRAAAPPLDRPLYRGAFVASAWLLLLIALTIAVQVPFALVRFVGISDPNEALAIAQKMSVAPAHDALSIGANVVAALLHVLLRPLLAIAFVVVYYDARAGAQPPAD
jgi:hypothetical protein